MNILAVAIGGAFGSVFRYLLTIGMLPIGSATAKGTYLWGTLIVNAVGCGLAGVLLALKSKWNIPESLWNGLTFGVLGGLTTFSTFTSDTFRLFLQGDLSLALGNMAVNLASCFAFIVLGYYVTRFFAVS